MTINKKTKFSTKRLALNAAMVALYFALSLLAVPMGGLKLTFEHLPVILSALIFGPVDAMLVGGLGELVNQMLTYGLTPTTVLWMMPALFRGLSMGLGAWLIKSQLSLDAVLKQNLPIVFMITCVISGLICSVINTAVLCLDSKLYGYYSYHMVFGVFWVRLAASAVSSVLMVVAAKPVAHALKKARMI